MDIRALASSGAVARFPFSQVPCRKSVVEAKGSYVSGTCKELKASGAGSDFTPGDANYTSA